MDLSALSNRELWLRLRQTDQRLGELAVLADTKPARLWRTAKLAGGVLVTFGSIVLAPPTGGATMILTGIGLILLGEGFRDDAGLYGLSMAAAAEQRRLLALSAEIARELERRGIAR